MISSSLKTSQWLNKVITKEGMFEHYPIDISCYYKAPYFFSQTGQQGQAELVLQFIKNTFFKTNDFSLKDQKIDNPALRKFWGYVLGWIAIGAHKSSRFDLSYPMYHYLRKFYSEDHGGFATHGPWGEADDTMDILTTAHFGRLHLFMGDIKRSEKAGEFLGWMINHQPHIQDELLLCSNNSKAYVTNFPQDQAFFYTVKKHEPQQAYFMIGYPIAYLCELYQTTQNPLFLTYAKQYADFALQCHDSIKAFPYSHKAAWGMAILYRHTKENKYLQMCQDISNYLISIQNKDGVWLADENPIVSIDQTVENAIWLREIAHHLMIAEVSRMAK